MRALLLALAAAALCAGEPAGAKPVGAYEPVDWSAEARPGRTGQYDAELKDPLKHTLVMKYRMYAPAALPDQAHLGVVICCHGMNGNETHLAPPIRDSFAKLGLAGNYLIAGLKSQGAGWSEADEPLVLQYLDWLETVYPVDRRRVFLVGMSNGGWMASWFGGRHHDRFAGITRWCGYIPRAPQAKDAATTQTEYYLVHGDADDQVKVDGSRSLRKSLRELGYRYVFREIDGGGHVDILGNLAVREDDARWMDALRHKQIAPPEADIRFLRQFANGAKATDLFALPTTWDELVRIGGAPAWTALARAVKHEQAAVRLAAAQACARGGFAGDETVAALARLGEDADAAVRAAAIAALKVHANWRSDAAQLALGKLALRRKGEAADRTAAAEALGAVLPLPFLGNYDDDTVAIQAVVALLDADLPEVRAAAFTELKRKVPDGLGYDPAAADGARSSPIAAWKAWFAERMAPPIAAKAGARK